MSKIKPFYTLILITKETKAIIELFKTLIILRTKAYKRIKIKDFFKTYVFLFALNELK